MAQPKRLAVFVYLVLARPGELIRRDRLLPVFWPETNETQARNALSQSLSFLRRHLDEDILLTRGIEEVGARTSDIRVDALVFQEAAERGAWAEARGLYSGDFLSGFHIRGAPEFEEWMHEERGRLRARAAEVGWALASDQVRRGLAPEAENAATWAMGLVCPDEARVRRFMEKLAESGDAVSPVRLFERYRTVLRVSLDLEPPRELEELCETIRAHALHGPTGAPADDNESRLPSFLVRAGNQAESRAGPRRFVGRKEELARLDSQLSETLDGRGRVVFITGEAGSGKSVLAQEFCRRSLERYPDLVTVTGYCDAYTGTGDPYRPFREVLRLLTGDVEGQWTAGSMSTDHARRLWELAPRTTEAILDAGPDLLETFVRSQAMADRAQVFRDGGLAWSERLLEVAGDRQPGGARRSDLFHQYGRVLRRLAKEHPMILVLEDLQWADGGSLDLLFHLGRNLSGSRILILGPYRPAEAALGRGEGRHPLLKMHRELSMSHSAAEIGLGDEGDRAFLDALVDTEPNVLGEEFRDALMHRTRGHALFTSELLRGLKETGSLRKDSDGRWTEDGPREWYLLSDRVEAVIGERIGRVPHRLRRILDLASVEGEYFTLEVLAEALGRAPADLVHDLSGELVKRHRLVQPVEVAGDARGRRTLYRFNHILFQEYLYHGLDEAERILLHESIGRALEAVLEVGADEHALALARHFREAGDIQRSIDYLVFAAEWAKEAVAYRESMDLFSEALEMIGGQAPSLDRDRRELEVLLPLSTMASAIGSQSPGGAILERSARLRELAAKLGDDDARFWACCCGLTNHHFKGEELLTRAVLDEAEEIANRTGNPSQKVQVEQFRALNSLNLGRPVRTLAHLDAFEALYEPERDRRYTDQWVTGSEVLFRALRGLALAPLGFPDQAVEVVDEARNLLETESDPGMIVCVRLWDLLVRWLIRDHEDARRLSGAYLEIAGGFGPSGWLFFGEFSEGWWTWRLVDPEEGVRKMEEARKGVERSGWELWRPCLNTLLAEALLEVGREEKALSLLDDALDRVQRKGEGVYEPEVRRVRGELLKSRGDPGLPGAETAFREAIAAARKQEAKLFELRATTSLARLLQSQGKKKEARKALGKCYRWFSEGFDYPDLKEARAVLRELE
jgi:DNA-binding SARP family transcriptional activator/tetratricopeptide (TPR) repeat protein